MPLAFLCTTVLLLAHAQSPVISWAAARFYKRVQKLCALLQSDALVTMSSYTRSSGLSWKRLFFAVEVSDSAHDCERNYISIKLRCVRLCDITGRDVMRRRPGCARQSPEGCDNYRGLCVCTLVRLSAVFHLMVLLFDSLFALPVH